MAKTKFARPPQGGPIVIPNCAGIGVLFQQNGVNLSIRLHAALTAAGPLNPAVAESIFSAIKAATSTTAWLTHMSTTITLSGTSVKDLRAANNPTLLSTSAGLAGTGTGTPLSQATALCVTLRTAQSGRGFVGRAYLPGLTSSALAAANRWDTVSTTPAAVAFVQGIQAAIQASIGGPVIGQRTLLPSTVAGAPPPFNQTRPANTVPITAVNIASTLVDQQRRRIGR